MKHLILIDDHKMLRKGIASFFAENSDWKILAEGESLDDVQNIISSIPQYIHTTPPPEKTEQVVAVVDIQLKGSDGDEFSGFKAVKMLLDAGVPSVIFSSHDTGACIERAMGTDVGAKGFVSKLSDEKMLLEAVEAVAGGKVFIQPDLLTSFMETQNLFSMLTKRERQVVTLLQDGRTNEEIASALGIKITTLENYITVIYDKTGCKDKNSLLEKLRGRGSE